MSTELDKAYEPKKVETRIYQIWEKSGFFDPDKLPNRLKKTYSIVIPPPNITGSLHMGHALNAALQDILIRKRRMEGYRALWVPGTDHAGIAAQYVVEKQLKKEGLNRFDIGREKFLARMWQWMRECGGNIESGLKRLGLSCDWSRTRFTMDNDYQKAVEDAFLYYHKKGWIYRAERVINWCPRCQTSLSDLELEYKEEKAKLYWIKYGPFVLATTRPETKLGDTAVAVHPGDERYKDMVGKEYEIPGVLGNFKIKVVADRAIDPNFGSGAVKVTPSHSIIDSEIAERHDIPFKQIIDKNGRMMENCGKYAGMKTDEAREEIVRDMEKMGLIDHIDENYAHNIALCYRCGSVVENLPSLQWFLKMPQLAKMAIKAVEKKKVVFHPARWAKTYLNWLKNVRDWNISRQIWWGHKIPINGVDDVLDTWFSSALWPFAIFNKKSDLKKFYPTNTLVTDRGIINLWVARMIFSGMEFMKKPPFKDVIIHATILTKEGKRMSKSLGTGLDPLDFVEKYGADATRFAMIWQAMGGQDIHWSEEALIAGKKFLNKIWNAARFVLERTEPSAEVPRSGTKEDLKSRKLTNADKEILSKLKEITKKTSKNIDKFEFGQALHDLYEFFWHDFCDKYIEASKLQMSDINLKDNTQKILFYILSTSLKILHPFIPHITEEIWSKIPLKNKSALIIEKWPTT